MVFYQIPPADVHNVKGNNTGGDVCAQTRVAPGPGLVHSLSHKIGKQSEAQKDNLSGASKYLRRNSRPSSESNSYV